MFYFQIYQIAILFVALIVVIWILTGRKLSVTRSLVFVLAIVAASYVTMSAYQQKSPENTSKSVSKASESSSHPSMANNNVHVTQVNYVPYRDDESIKIDRVDYMYTLDKGKQHYTVHLSKNNQDFDTIYLTETNAQDVAKLKSFIGHTYSLGEQPNHWQVTYRDENGEEYQTKLADKPSDSLTKYVLNEKENQYRVTDTGLLSANSNATTTLMTTLKRDLPYDKSEGLVFESIATHQY